ncbi:DUF4376 domain-containing protein [Salmonella enterica]
MMKYFKDEKNNVYAYAADGSEDDFIQPELIAISEVEAMAIVKPLPDIEDARSQKHAEINRWRNTQENANYTFTFDNHKWDYGKATQERLTLSVQMAKANKLPAGFIWTDADNNDVPMTAGELLNLSDAIDQAMFTKGLQIHMRQREMKEEIDKLTDVKAILDYKIGWPDIPTK